MTRKDKKVLVKKSFQIIEEFFWLVDSDKLFDSRDFRHYRKVRREIADALNCLLVWKRPELEAERGIMWPYHGFRSCYEKLRAVACGSGFEYQKQQARLFLILLPFPGQWNGLIKAEKEDPSEEELRFFLADEKYAILRKLRKKPQKSYKLRHFCQVLKSFRSAREKGILRVFSLPYLFVCYPKLLDTLSSRYVFYVEPPMGVLFRHAWWRYFTGLEDPCIFGIGSKEDIEFLKHQHCVETVPLAHGDYMEEGAIEGSRDQKRIDIVFNATYDDMPRKRHKFMLELLRHPLLSEARALFLGRGKPAKVEKFKKLVRESGLGNRVTVSANLSRSEVPELLAQCKVGVHLSLYENACRSVYEYLRSDLPCVISSSMGGMNLDIFNPKTGYAVPDKRLPEAIFTAIRNRGQFKPREWFLENSGSNVSTRRLNEMLKGFFKQWGYDWSEDLVLLGSSGASRYVDPQDYHRLSADFRWIQECFVKFYGGSFEFCIE